MGNFSYSILDLHTYPEAPFYPPCDYPEFNGIFQQFDTSNKLYAEIRALFIASGYDLKNQGSKQWNPFRDYIKNGQTVIIKPNLVINESNELSGKNCLTTNASIIRPIIDYLILLQKQESIKFEIVIADIPIQSADFDKILNQTGLKSLREFYQQNGIDFIKIYDLRHKLAVADKSGFLNKISVNGDPMGYTKIHLEQSFLDEITKDYKKFGVSGYEAKETFSQIEQTGLHFYHIPNSVLNADLFINIPKLKTHQKAGITAAMKNLIGINGEKAWIPHYRRGSKNSGGDEYDNNQAFLKAITTKANLLLQGKSKFLWNLGKGINARLIKPFFRPDYRTGNNLTVNERKALFLTGGAWFGNDTIWRPILDLNYLLFYVDKTGKESSQITRKYICLTDGIIAGEGDGPLNPDPKNAGIIALSENPIINDICLSRIMGFDWLNIPQLERATRLDKFFNFSGNTKEIKIIECVNKNMFNEVSFDNLPNLKFTPPPGWIGHIELKL
jgi:uncharacterized protein (DUF362 family)